MSERERNRERGSRWETLSAFLAAFVIMAVLLAFSGKYLDRIHASISDEVYFGMN